MTQKQQMGARVRRLRKALNLTQVGLAKKLRTSQACVSQIEAGIIEPRLALIKKIGSLHTHYPVAWILEGK